MNNGLVRLYLLAFVTALVSSCGSGASKGPDNSNQTANLNDYCMYYKLELKLEAQTKKPSLHHVVFAPAEKHQLHVPFYEYINKLTPESDINVDELLTKKNILQEIANIDKYKFPLAAWNRETIPSGEVYVEDSDLKFIECCGMTAEEIAQVKKNIGDINSGVFPGTKSKLEDETSTDFRPLNCAGTAALVSQSCATLKMPDFSKEALSPDEGLDGNYYKSHLTTTRFYNFMYKKGGALESGQCKELPIHHVALTPQKQKLLEKLRLEVKEKGKNIDAELPDDTLLRGRRRIEAKLVDMAQAHNDLTYPNRMIESVWEITNLHGEIASDSIDVGKRFILVLPSIINRVPNALINKIERKKAYFVEMYEVPQSVNRTARDTLDNPELFELPIYFSVSVFSESDT